MGIGRTATVICLLLGGAALADDPEWRVTSRGRVELRQRTLPDSNVTELRAEGVVRAPLKDIEAALLDFTAYPRFIPYVRACEYVQTPATAGKKLVYTRLAVPLVADRDYVLEMSRRRRDGDAFQLSWTSHPDAVPEVKGVVRLRINHGSWRGTRDAQGTYLVYTVSAEPGPGVSPVFVRLTNPRAVADLFDAVEREALRRARQRGAITATSG